MFGNCKISFLVHAPITTCSVSGHRCIQHPDHGRVSEKTRAPPSLSRTVFRPSRSSVSPILLLLFVSEFFSVALCVSSSVLVVFCTPHSRHTGVGGSTPDISGCLHLLDRLVGSRVSSDTRGYRFPTSPQTRVPGGLCVPDYGNLEPFPASYSQLYFSNISCYKYNLCGVLPMARHLYSAPSTVEHFWRLVY